MAEDNVADVLAVDPGAGQRFAGDEGGEGSRRVSFRLPPQVPMAVRTAPTMTTFRWLMRWVLVSVSVGVGRCKHALNIQGGQANYRPQRRLFDALPQPGQQHPDAMRTFWIADPMPTPQARSPLTWGSSEWAADSCLAEWSEFEREWTGEPAPKRLRRVLPKAVRAAATVSARETAPPAPPAPPLPPFLGACFVLFALGLAAFAWSVFRTLSS